MKANSETTGWKRMPSGGYQKSISGNRYHIFSVVDDCKWCLSAEGLWPHAHKYLSDAKRAAHKHAREKA